MINCQSLDGSLVDEAYVNHLMSFNMVGGNFREHGHPDLPHLFAVDLIGSELKWMNEEFPKDRFVWYHWFESVFLVPEEMAFVLRLKWS